MSTKTLTKRVALATVVALGAGVLSLVTVSSANAADAGAGLLVVGANQSNGLNPTSVTVGTPASGGQLASTVSTSTGANQLLSTGTYLSTGSIGISFSATSGQTGVSVVGGTITSAASIGASATNFLVTNGTYASTTGSATGLDLQIVPNAGSAQVTIYGWSGVTASSTTSSGGTLTAQDIIAITSSATSGTVSVSKSGIYYGGTQASTATSFSPYGYTPAGGSGTIVDNNVSTTGTSDYSQQQDAAILARDAYSNAITTGTLITVSATNGAYVGLNSSTTLTSLGGVTGTTPVASSSTLSLTAGTSSNAYVVSTASKYYGLEVTNPTSAPLTTTVTVSVGGVVIGTKAFTFTGKVAKVVLSAPTNGKTSTTGSATIAFLDAAGNTLNNSNTTTLPNTVTQDANTTGTGISVVGTLVIPTSGTYYTQVNYNCGATDTVGQIAVDFTNPLDGSVVVSNGVPATCSGVPYTFKAALDKASYNPGDIATLKVTFSDSLGSIAADYGYVGSGTASTPTNNIAGGYLSPSSTGVAGGNAGTYQDTTTNGVATYKFIVGAPASNYSSALVVSFPAASGMTSSVTVPYSISVGGTSLNDVLKAIVSLIASINKQIAALAKVVSKK
jgi:trimeric autotransporter adhesin